MENLEAVMQLIFSAIDELNRQLAADQRLEQSADTALFGESGKLDSLGLINLIVGVEENVAEAFDVAINLADESALSGADSPFQTVRTLADHVSLLLESSR